MPVSSPALPADAGSFSELGLPEPLLRALADVGYETPSPIQAATIPALLAGRDMLGQAQTGTGKTAAFSLPSLHRLAADPRARKPASCPPPVPSPISPSPTLPASTAACARATPSAPGTTR